VLTLTEQADATLAVAVKVPVVDAALPL